MKKSFLFLIITGLFVLSSCDKDQDSMNGVLDPVQVQRALVLETTATWCQYCPNGAEILMTAEYQFNDILPIAIHTGDPLSNPTGDAFDSNFPPGGVPNFYVGNNDVGQSPNGAISAMIIQSPQAGVGHEWEKEGSSYNITSRVKFYTGVSGDYYVGCYYINGPIDACGSLTQTDGTGALQNVAGCSTYLDNAVMVDAYQDNQGQWQGVYLINEGDTYKHAHSIAGHAGTNVWGESLGSSSVSSGEKYDFNFTINEGFGWTQNGKILTVLWKKNGSSYEFINGYFK